MKANHWEEILDRTLEFAIGFWPLSDGEILAPSAGQGKWSNFAQFSLFESKFDHLIPYVNEIKSLSRISEQDP